MAVPGGGAFQADFGRRGVELEERGAAGAGAPFVELGGLSDEAEEVQEPDARAGGGGAGQRRARGSGPWRRPLPAAERLRQAFGRRARAAQAQVLSLLHLLTCSLTTYFFEHLSPRNVIFLAMSAGVWLTAWLTLEPSTPGWAVGLVYVLSSCARAGLLEPLWTAALALAAQCAFDLAGAAARKALWFLLGFLAVAAEPCWWPSAQLLIETDFHGWLVHFSTYYVVVVDFWLWPQLLQLDPSRWRITREIERAPEETQQAIVDVGAGLLALVLLPLLACSLMAVIIIWRRNPGLCLSITGVYFGLLALVVLFRNAPPEQVVAVGQVPIALIFVILAREQLVHVFDDTQTWKAQGLFLAVLLLLRYLLTLGIPVRQTDQFYAAAVLVLQLASRQWLAAQCAAAQLGLPSAFRREAWAPRWSGLLFAREEVHARSVTLAR